MRQTFRSNLSVGVLASANRHLSDVGSFSPLTSLPSANWLMVSNASSGFRTRALLRLHDLALGASVVALLP